LTPNDLLMKGLFLLTSSRADRGVEFTRLRPIAGTDPPRTRNSSERGHSRRPSGRNHAPLSANRLIATEDPGGQRTAAQHDAPRRRLSPASWANQPRERRLCQSSPISGLNLLFVNRGSRRENGARRSRVPRGRVGLRVPGSERARPGDQCRSGTRGEDGGSSARSVRGPVLPG
jgi:hypothetical protein